MQTKAEPTLILKWSCNEGGMMRTTCKKFSCEVRALAEGGFNWMAKNGNRSYVPNIISFATDGAAMSACEQFLISRGLLKALKETKK